MRKDPDFEEKVIMLGGHRVKAIIPKKTITQEEFLRETYKILKKSIKCSGA